MTPAANPFAQLLQVATQPVVDARAPAGALPGERKYQTLVRLIRKHSGISTADLAQAAGLCTRRVWGLLKVQVERGVVQHDSSGWTALPMDMTPSTEQLTWYPASMKPDSDITVLAWNQTDSYFCAWWDAGLGQWIDCATGGLALVTHWAIPNGPR